MLDFAQTKEERKIDKFFSKHSVVTYFVRIPNVKLGEVLHTRWTGDQIAAEAANAGRTLLMNHRRQFDPWTVSPTRQLAISLGLEKSGETERNREREKVSKTYLANFWPASGLG